MGDMSIHQLCGGRVYFIYYMANYNVDLHNMLIINVLCLLYMCVLSSVMFRGNERGYLMGNK